MNRYRTTTLFALALALPGSAWSLPAAQEACESLKAQAAKVLGSVETLRCRAEGETLAIEGPEVDFQQVRAAVFPQDRYREFAVVRRQAVAAAVTAASPAVPVVEKGPALGKTFRGLTALVDFDGAAARRGSIVLVGGPPGSTPPGQKTRKPQKPATDGPPGSQAPGRQLPGNDAPPSSSEPSSRPTPVFVPSAPPPNYWNTVDWGTVPMWADLPSDWQQSEFDEQRNRYVTRWYPHSRPFVSDIGYTKDSKAVTRRAGTDALALSMTSRQVIEVKQCYYQGVYDLRWNSFEGRWDGSFSHYRAACRRSEDYGNTIRSGVEVRFDMQGQSLLPWEAEIVRASFDGREMRVGLEEPAFQYARSSSGDAVYYRAGAKLRTPPDEGGVTAELVPDGQTLKLRVSDKWAAYYAGETLEVSLKLMYVTPGWFTRNEPVDVRAYAQGNQIRWTPSAPPGAPGAGGGFTEGLTTKGCGTYYLESWSFRRVNNGQPDNKSRTSSDAVVQKGGSKRIKLCR